MPALPFAGSRKPGQPVIFARSPPPARSGCGFDLAEKLRTGALGKRIFKAPREFSVLRELSRIHLTLVRDVVRVQARLKSLYRSRGIPVPGGRSTALATARIGRGGLRGVGLYARRPAEGRLQLAHFGRLLVANAYFSKGSGTRRDNSRVPYKLAFTAALFERLERLRRGGLRVLAVGDFNTAYREIDLARPAQNRETSGFLPEERAELDRWLAAGWIDTFRAFEPGPGHYSWWRQRFGVRGRNVGWRIDQLFASPAAMRFVRGAFLEPRIAGSDHCPVGVEIDPAIFG